MYMPHLKPLEKSIQYVQRWLATQAMIKILKNKELAMDILITRMLLWCLSVIRGKC